MDEETNELMPIMKKNRSFFKDFRSYMLFWWQNRNSYKNELKKNSE